MLSASTPVASASLAWARRWVASPWTGMKAFGFTRVSMIFSSSAPAWPDTCTLPRLLSYTSAPILARELMTRVTAFSLPGTGVAEMMTVSPSSISMVLCSPLAMRPRALKGSPWLPVHMMTTWSEGMPFRS